VKYYVQVNGRQHEVDVVERLGEIKVAVDGKPLDISYEEVDTLGQVALLCEGESFGVSIDGDMAKASVVIAGHLYAVEIEDERERAAHAAERAASKGGGLLKAIMPGLVVKLNVAEGELVEAGQALLILEAMKMQNEIASPAGGRIKTIHVKEREAVAAGAKLVTIVPVE
jgi:biotin carboxyl carrier protein